MVIKSAIIAVLTALPALSIAVPAVTGTTLTLSVGALSLDYDSRDGFDLGIEAACFVTRCPLAQLSIARREAPPSVTAVGYRSV
ncbi:MAG: hypothetical protein U9P68_13775 [Pseudomonadota bacterium]|nr:hypothetical protein [Pseudomonadota bacterium]